jgi:hypothetical protein
MKSRIHVIVLLAIAVAMLIPVGVSSFVYAQPCTATLSNPVIPTQYGNSNVPFVIPVSASCTTYYNQLYATGNAYDATSNIGLGTANAVLLPVNGGTQFNGQLGFSLSPTSPSDSVQISVSIYGSQGGSLITQTSETVQVGAGEQQPLQQITTTTVTVGQYPYANPSPTAYQSPYQPNQFQYYPNQPMYQQEGHGHHFHPSYYFSQGFPYSSNNQNLFDWVVIIAIIASVIIATVGLLLVARRQQPLQPVWYPAPPPPPSR